jgi:hypothetical protein
VLTATDRWPMPCKATEAGLALSRPLYATPKAPDVNSAWLLELPVALSTLPDEPWRTAQCAPHPPLAVS